MVIRKCKLCNTEFITSEDSEAEYCMECELERVQESEEYWEIIEEELEEEENEEEEFYFEEE